MSVFPLEQLGASYYTQNTLICILKKVFWGIIFIKRELQIRVRRVYTGFAMTKDCVFCKIIKGELRSTKEFENEKIVAFRDINPVAPIHVLIVPKKHITRLTEVGNGDKDLLGEVLLVASNLAKKLQISDAFRVLNTNGEKAGQTVPHIHFHLIGGWKEKNIKMESDPGGLRK